MIGRPSCRLRLNAVKAELGQVKLIDQHIDRPDRIVLAQIVWLRGAFDMRDLGRVFTHIHDQEIEISERFYLDL
jgi:hypothetical protein